MYTPGTALLVMWLLLATLLCVAPGLVNSKELEAKDYPIALSFSLPPRIGALNAGDGGCCPFGGLPLPHAKGLARPAMIGIGAHKAGTSFLFNLLKLHPGFVPPRGKKELYMLGQWPLDGEDAFHKYLQAWNVRENELRSDQVLYEFTATYLHTAGAPCRVKALLPDAKFVAVLRDPVARSISHWNMNMDMYQRGVSRFKPNKYKDSISRELQRLQDKNCTFNSGRPGKQWNDCFQCHYTLTEWEPRRDACKPQGLLRAPIEIDNPCKPKLELWMYVAYGYYAAPLAWWLNFFPPERFLIINNDELRAKPVDVANRVAMFMGLEPLFTEELMKSRQAELDENAYQAAINITSPEIQDTVETLKKEFLAPVRDLYQLARLVGWDFAPFKEWPEEEVFAVKIEDPYAEL